MIQTTVAAHELYPKAALVDRGSSCRDTRLTPLYVERQGVPEIRLRHRTDQADDPPTGAGPKVFPEDPVAGVPRERVVKKAAREQGPKRNGRLSPCYAFDPTLFTCRCFVRTLIDRMKAKFVEVSIWC